MPILNRLPEKNKAMFHITNDLMNRARQTVVPKYDGGPAELAEFFILVTFFIDNIVDIYSRLTSDDVCNLAMKSTSTFSPDMDVVGPTYDSA